MCQVFNVSSSAYYSWRKNKDVVKPISQKMIVKEAIKKAFKESREIYGSYRIQVELSKVGLNYSKSYIAVLMKEMGLRSVLKRKFVVTTDSKYSYPVAENLLERDFTSDKLGEKWVSDITYIRVNNKWNYLTTIIDLADRKVVGWSLSQDMTAENTIGKAWTMARSTRKISNNLIVHSDRGVQYAAKKKWNPFLFNRKIKQSMSRKGDCWDNAVAESFFKTIKYECLYRYKFSFYNHLFLVVNDYINWYNTKRIHSALNYMTPLEKEAELRKIKTKKIRKAA